MKDKTCVFFYVFLMCTFSVHAHDNGGGIGFGDQNDLELTNASMHPAVDLAERCLEKSLIIPEHLAIAQAAFQEYRQKNTWLDQNIVVKDENLNSLLTLALRAHLTTSQRNLYRAEDFAERAKDVARSNKVLAASGPLLGLPGPLVLFLIAIGLLS